MIFSSESDKPTPEIFLNHSGKQDYLIEQLTKPFETDNESELVLTILSCYINIDSIIDLVDQLKLENIKLEKSNIYFDINENVTRCEAIREKEKTIHEKKINLFIVDQKYLFHPKAYCLVNEEKKKGALCIASANLTMSGITKNERNTELFITIYDYEQIEFFLQKVQDIESEPFDFDKIYEYELLQYGHFLNQWNNYLQNKFRLRYIFAEDIKENQKLKKLATEDSNFKVIEDKKSSYLYFDLKKIKDELLKKIKKRELPKKQDITREYGIETCIGYWIPTPIVEAINDFYDSDFAQFQNYVQEYLKQDLGSKNNLPESSRLVSRLWENIKYLIGDNEEKIEYITGICTPYDKTDNPTWTFEKIKEDSKNHYKNFLLEIYDFLEKEIKDLFNDNDIRLKRVHNNYYFWFFSKEYAKSTLKTKTKTYSCPKVIEISESISHSFN
jgi:hypothetical protein